MSAADAADVFEHADVLGDGPRLQEKKIGIRDRTFRGSPAEHTRDRIVLEKLGESCPEFGDNKIVLASIFSKLCFFTSRKTLFWGSYPKVR